MKVCRVCGEEKPLSEFHRRKGSPDGHRNDCKECNRAESREWYRQNRDEWKEHSNQYYAENRKERIAYKRRYHKQNVDAHRAYMKKYYRKNKEAAKIARRRWAKRNPVKRRAISQRYTARKNGAPGRGVTAEDIERILERDGHQCLVCGAIEDLEMDHIIPLSRGGAHDPSNLQTLCRSCNSSKYTRATDFR